MIAGSPRVLNILEPLLCHLHSHRGHRVTCWQDTDVMEGLCSEARPVKFPTSGILFAMSPRLPSCSMASKSSRCWPELVPVGKTTEFATQILRAGCQVLHAVDSNSTMQPVRAPRRFRPLTVFDEQRVPVPQATRSTNVTGSDPLP